jgi:glycosyltransferase involved in cell wall biosynthesis
MAMERPIVASALDQIGEVLEHERTAILVRPGEVESLAAGLRRVVEDRALGARLGASARAEVLRKYTWTKHVSVILDALAHAGGAPPGSGRA